MGWSGLLYAAIVVGWAAYLIPHALRRYDQAARSRSIDKFSSAMRVLGRKDDSGTITTVKPSGPSGRAPTAEQVRARRAAQRRAARVAARRRRRVLMVLLLATMAVACVAWFALIPWWSVAIPAGLAVLFLLVCACRVRREAETYWTTASPPSAAAAEAPSGADTRRAARVESAYGSAKQRRSARVAAAVAEQVDPDEEPTVVLDRGEVARIAVPVQTSDGQTLWDPVPVTLPTYVSKPKATRTIRTIDLSQPGTWTSGNTDEASELAERADGTRAHGDADDMAEDTAGVVEEHRRAVGT